MSSSTSTTATGITMISGFCGDRPASVTASTPAAQTTGIIPDVQSLAMEWAAKLREANVAAALTAPPPPPPSECVAMMAPVVNTAAA